MIKESDTTDGARRGRLPEWLRISTRGAPERERVRHLLSDLRLNTVCESAMCPNLCECWASGTATFMILGSACTRDCRFCAVPHTGAPPAPEADEPARVAEAAVRLELRYVVLTSVTRDDLPDGGAAHFAAVVRAIRARMPETGVEVLTPDFGGRGADVRTVVDATPTVFNHNLETCERLTGDLRSGANYRRSLKVLRMASDLGRDAGVFTKSGLMLGLGETDEEIRTALADLRACGVRILTLGQYLAPSKTHWPVANYVTPEAFEEWGRVAREDYGFDAVASAPFVRSSYRAHESARTCREADVKNATESEGHPCQT